MYSTLRKVTVVPYNQNWKAIFNDEARKLMDIYGDEIVEIHHIGSTSVKGLSAKPIIDILPVVNNINNVDLFNNEMIELGYEPKGENGIPTRRYFQKGGDNRTHHVHMYEVNNPEIIRHLAFRDYLRTHPEQVKIYGKRKTELSLRFPLEIESYIKGKEPLVQEIEQKALEWYEGGGKLNEKF
jgi:GrpB-like predicted nucleotidyltransferase (UPF0157 family)